MALDTKAEIIDRSLVQKARDQRAFEEGRVGETTTETMLWGLPVQIEVHGGYTRLYVQPPTTFGLRIFSYPTKISRTHMDLLRETRGDLQPLAKSLFQEIKTGEAENPEAIAWQIVNQHYREPTGSPLQDALLIHQEPGMAVVAVADGLESRWGTNKQTRAALERNNDNPPLALAATVLRELLNQFSKFNQERLADAQQLVSKQCFGPELPPQLQKKVEQLLQSVSQTIEQRAQEYVRKYVHLHDQNREIAAGATLAAAIYLKGIGLTMIKTGNCSLRCGLTNLAPQMKEDHFWGQKMIHRTAPLGEISAQPIQWKPEIVFLPETEVNYQLEYPLVLGTNWEQFSQLLPGPILVEKIGPHTSAAFREKMNALRKSGANQDATVVLTSAQRLQRIAGEEKTSTKVTP